MWILANPNPMRKQVPDCVVRAISIALNEPWLKIFDDLYYTARRDFNMPSADAVWGHYLMKRGFEPFILPGICPRCTTINEFTKQYPKGVYIIGTGAHAVAVIDGNYYDSWDSGNEIPTFFWRIKE